MTCPLCHSNQKNRVASIEPNELVQMWAKNLDIDVSDTFNGVPRVDLLICHQCSLRYFAPNILAGTDRIYGRLEKLDWYYMPRKWEHDIAIHDLAGCQKILEVGCGFGDFLAYAREEHSLHIEGIERNKSAVQVARNRGLPVRYLDLNDAAEQCSGQYNAVCSFQVLEHVSNPRQFLESSCHLLKPGGKLILGIPNADSFLKYQFNILDMPPHHMTRWDRRVLSRLPDLFPLQLLHWRQEPLAAYHVKEYVNAHCAHLSKNMFLRALCAPRLRNRFAGFLKYEGIRKYLKGQTLYACFKRI